MTEQKTPLRLKQKVAILIDRILTYFFVVISLPFIIVLNSLNKIFQFFADFSQDLEEFIIAILQKIYHFLTDLIIKIVGDK